MSLATELLLTLAASQPERNRLQSIARNPNFDWADFFSLAQRHRMVGVAVPLLREMLDGQFSGESFHPWLKRWETLALQDLHQMFALEEIVSGSSRRGLSPLLLKGMSIHLQAYPSEGTARESGDLDLMVRPSEVPSMVECLEELGFVFRGTDSWSRPVSSWKIFIEQDSEALFYRGNTPVAVDLHWRLCDPRLEKSSGITLSERIRQGTRTLSLGRTAVAIPGREEELLLLCFHLFKGGTFFLKNLCDIAHLLRADPPINRDRLVSLGKETGTLGCLDYTFRLVAQFDPGALPSWTRPTPRPAAWTSWILAPSLQMERLLASRGESFGDLSRFWNGVLFSRHPWRWLPYQTGRVSRWLARRVAHMLR